MFWPALFLLTQTSSNMLPFNSEKLAQPVELQCGLKIDEWRGNKVLNEERLNELCDMAKEELPKFLKKEKNIDVEFIFFNWNSSFIPSGSCSRCLNDLNGRFKDRQDRRKLTGYTNYNINHMFVSTDDSEFDTTFVHELYHAMTDYNGYLFSTAEDEKLARKFTRKLGLGE